MDMRYGILALDVDDTLFGQDKVISAANLHAIRRAQAAGVYVTLATGRGFRGASSVWKALNIRGPIITYGGAQIVNTLDGQPLISADIETELVSEALTFAHELGVHAQIYQKDVVIFESENAFTQRYTRRLSLEFRVDREIREKRWYNVPKVLYFVEPEREKEAIAACKAHFNGRLEVATSMPGYIELNRHGTHKGSALAQLAHMLGSDLENCAAIGDNTLDLEMIKMAGLGVCVENGQPEVKAAAKLIAPDCANDAVAWLIDNYLLAGGVA